MTKQFANITKIERAIISIVDMNTAAKILTKAELPSKKMNK
jgi:hypothetical protein